MCVNCSAAHGVRRTHKPILLYCILGKWGLSYLKLHGDGAGEMATIILFSNNNFNHI